MKLYSQVCVGLLVVFVCQTPPPPPVVSDFCQAAGPNIIALRGLTDPEIAALTRQRKEAILALRTKYKKLCGG
jgi:hypothetical protein